MDEADCSAAFADLADWCVGTSRLYERVCRGAADDEAVLSLATRVPDHRSPPHVTLAAVHYLLLRGVDAPLADYYPSVTADPRDPAGVSPAFHDFCVEHADALVPLLESRGTQTNSVRRSAALYPAISHVADRADGPLALVELGSSAGLNLAFDRYAYDYGTGRRVGATDSPVVVDARLHDPAPDVPDAPPTIHSRVGVDLDPLDVTDDEDADWLRALVWPDHEDRHALLDAALDHVADDPPTLVEGDAVERLPGLVSQVAEDVPVCVFNTNVLYQMPEGARARLREEVYDLMAEREVYWLSGEGGVEGFDNGIGLYLTRRVDGPAERRVGVFEQHGRWVSWAGAPAVRRESPMSDVR